MTNVRGGAARPVKIVTDADLEENGGDFALSGNQATAVYGYEDDGTRSIGGGPARAIYIVSDDDLASGRFRLKSGAAQPVHGFLDSSLRSIRGDAAMPVYVRGGLEAWTLANNGLLAYYKLEGESGGVWPDASGNGYHLTPVNSPTAVAGVVGNGVECVSASSQYLANGSLSSAIRWDCFTVSFWLNVAGTELGLFFVKADDGSAIGCEPNTGSGGFMNVDTNGAFDGNGRSIVVYPGFSQWVQVSMVFIEGEYPVVFFNGQAAQDLEAALPLREKYNVLDDYSITELRIGRGNVTYADNELDEIGIWNRALTLAEIAYLSDGRTLQGGVML